MGGFRGRLGRNLLILATAALFPLTAQGDVVALKGGGILRGRVSDSSFSGRRDNRGRAPASVPPTGPTVTLTTMTGGRLVLDSSVVAGIGPRPLLFEEYEVRNRQTSEELGSLWKLAEWCRDRGLKAQREEALRRMVAIDPDHPLARQGLGQTKRDGKWKSHEEEMLDRGYVRYEGRWVAEQEIPILKKMHARKRVAHDWEERVHGWVRMLASANPERRRRGRVLLLAVSDSQAIPALNRYLRTSDDEEAREMYVNILARLSGSDPLPFLVQQALFDSSKSVRVAAQNAITPPRHEAASPLFAHELHNASNDVVRRAAVMLEKIGDERIIPNLIDALVTTHGVPTQVIEQSGDTYSFNPNRGMANPNQTVLPPDVYGKLATGQYPNGVVVLPQNGPTAPQVRTVLVDRQFRNAEVLAALEALTKQSFGYDKVQWKRWWAARTTTGFARRSAAP